MKKNTKANEQYVPLSQAAVNVLTAQDTF